MSRKFLIFVLVIAVLLVLVFVLGVGLGARKSKEPLDLEKMAGSFGKARALELRELSLNTPGTCGRVAAAALSIPRDQVCSLGAPASDGWPWQRRVLRLRSAQRVHLEVSAEKGPVKGDPDPGSISDLPLAREGNQIEIRCSSPVPACVVEVLR